MRIMALFVRTMALFLGAIALLAACQPTPSPVPSPTQSATSGTAIPTASSVAIGGPGLVMAGPIGLTLPAGWHDRTTLPNPSGDWTLLFAGPGDLPSECQGDANGTTACSSWPLTHLPPGGIVIAIRSYGNPGFKPPIGGDPITVSGIAARRITGNADGSCRGIDGTQLVEVWLPALVGENAFYSIDACMSGGDGAASAFAAILDSVVITSGAAPS